MVDSRHKHTRMHAHTKSTLIGTQQHTLILPSHSNFRETMARQVALPSRTVLNTDTHIHTDFYTQVEYHMFMYVCM